MEFQGGAGALDPFAALPLIDAREEIRSYSTNAVNPTAPTLVFGPQKMNAYSNPSGQPFPGLLFNATVGAPAIFYSPDNGAFFWRIERTVGQIAKGSYFYQFPLGYYPGVAPVFPAKPVRRYVWNGSAYRGPIEAGSILAIGVTSSNNNPRLLPSFAFGSDVLFALVSDPAVDGGNWTVQYRPQFAATARVVTLTGLSALVPRAFEIEFVEASDTAPGTITFTVSGVSVASFNVAQIAPVGGTYSPWWGLSFGSEGGVGAEFDFVGMNRLRVYGDE